MSLLERLKCLDLPSDEITITDAVYIDGPQNIIYNILNDLLKEHRWITISNINYNMLKHRYKGDITKATKYLLTQRTDTMIYENSNTNILLKSHYDLSNSMKLKFNNIEQQNSNGLQELYLEFCDQLNEYTMHKIILIIDCRQVTIEQWNVLTLDERNTLYLELLIQLTMLSKRQLLPLLDAIIICDMDDEKKMPQTNSKSLIVQFIYDILSDNCNVYDRILNEIDCNYIKRVILENHRPIEREYDLM